MLATIVCPVLACSALFINAKALRPLTTYGNLRTRALNCHPASLNAKMRHY
ncbi:hypothetical protein [Herbaspirillum sp. alder98]|uniref:hypothetical protein n=1 Tax=Herbaspirillum sp. alder98 TaxID=2913096 RepID=UPI001CD89E1B|nr:hypothetical protein [Herbaspirillum sp. alder98]MCA1326298.1 hypothetical protein [Herbaspirillum sp. alder98]